METFFWGKKNYQWKTTKNMSLVHLRVGVVARAASVGVTKVQLAARLAQGQTRAEATAAHVRAAALLLEHVLLRNLGAEAHGSDLHGGEGEQERNAAGEALHLIRLTLHGGALTSNLAAGAEDHIHAALVIGAAATDSSVVRHFFF